MDNQTQTVEPLTTYPARPSRKKNPLLKIIALILVLIVLFFIGKSIFGGKKQTQVVIPPTPTPTEFQFPTDTPSPSSSVTPSGSVTPTTVKSNPVDSSTGLDRSSVTVEVLNGSGVVGAASKASDTLKALGYDVVSSGNADNFDFSSTEIHIKSNKSKFVNLVKSDLSSSYTIGVAAADLDASASADIRVIVGKQ